jgi:hypothetical protein
MSPATQQVDRPPAPIPSKLTEGSLRQAAQECRACDLYEGATHLRSRTDQERGQAMQQFVTDLTSVARWLSAR